MILEDIIDIYVERPAFLTSISILVVITLINLALERSKSQKKGMVSFVLTVLALILVEVALIVLPLDDVGDRTVELFIFDEFARFFAMFAIFATIAVTVAIYYYSEGLPQISAFYALVSGTAIGLILLPSAVDLISIFVAWELLSVPLYAMVAYSHKWSRSVEGAIKYYVMGTASSAFLALGIGIFVAMLGATNIYILHLKLVALGTLDGFQRVIFGIGMAALIVGFGVKLTLVPIHQWAPDTYEGSMPPITAYLSGTIKAIRLSAPIKVFMFLAPSLLYYARVYLAILALLTMTYANIVALKQTRVYRMMAYSSIAQIGYIVIGIVAATLMGLTATIFYAFAFAIMEVTVFIAIGVIIYYLGLETIDDYDGLAKKYPSISIILALTLLGLVGIPPLIGFAGKVYLFIAAWDAGVIWLAIALALNSAISIGYYGLVIKRMFLEEPSDKIKDVEIPSLYYTILYILVAIMIIYGIFPTPIEYLSSVAARQVSYYL